MSTLSEYKSKDRINKLFLLVFHGGLLCYLFLHNFLLPLIRNIGQGNPFLNDMHYYFIPHGMLFFSFLFSSISKKEKNIVPLFISFNLTILTLSIFFFLFDVKDGVSVDEFTNLISLIASICFFLGFFIYFKKFFLLNISHMKYQFLLGIFLGLIFILFHETITQKITPSTTLPTQQIQENESVKIKITLPTSNFSKHEIHIQKDGFKTNQGLFSLNSKIKLINHSEKKHLLRLEYVKNHKWYFKKIISLDKKNTQTINFTEKGIYRLRSPSSKLGFFILVIGSHLFKKGIYILGKKKIEII